MKKFQILKGNLLEDCYEYCDASNKTISNLYCLCSLAEVQDVKDLIKVIRDEYFCGRTNITDKDIMDILAEGLGEKFL